MRSRSHVHACTDLERIRIRVEQRVFAELREGRVDSNDDVLWVERTRLNNATQLQFARVCNVKTNMACMPLARRRPVAVR